ncbi:response regulator [Sphingobacterium bambusae]|uniref:Response regulator n=1 Tax=Sphingobacterium bambusae TaxID=662858 RepID=A0ABW6BLZ1_9SPHI|nr:response regulator [Sphingobacterium bambusae]WPL47806.1 response regulator [Sphingobacterium bambusae]
MKMNRSVKIVFADDSDIHHFLLESLMSKFVRLQLLIKAKDGEELLHDLSEIQEIPDVAILDLHMPNMDGLSAAKDLLLRFPFVKIYGFTSSSDEKEKEAMLSSGFYKVFPKNKLRELLTELSELP